MCYIYITKCVCIYMYVCVYVYICVCVCIYITKILFKRHLRKWKGKIQTVRKYSQYIFLKGLASKIYKDCFQVNDKKTNQLKMSKTEQTLYKTCKWPISPWRYSTSLVIRQMQVKTIIIYQHTPIRTAKSKSLTKRVNEDVQKLEN